LNLDGELNPARRDGAPAPSVGPAGIGERIRTLSVALRPRWIGAIAAFAGLFANLAHAPFFFWPAMAVSLMVLLWLIDGAARKPRPAKAAFWRAWAFAAGHFLGGLYWVSSAFMVDAETFGMLAPFAVVAMAGGLALFWGAAFAIATRFWTDDLRRLFVFTVAVMAAELVRGHLFGGFPWNLAGTIWPAGEALSQSAAWIGVYGLTALTVFALASPAVLIDGRGSFGARVVPLVTCAMMGGMMWAIGEQRLAAPEPEAQGPLVRVVDPGFSQAEKWAPGNASEVLNAYLQLSGGPDARAPIVIWPEGALPLLALENPAALDLIGDRLGDRTLVMGITRREEQADGRLLLFNSLAVMRRDGRTARPVAFYDKHRLTPFGEFIPFYDLVSWMGFRALQQIGTGFTPGLPPTSMEMPGAARFAPMICYEALFPLLMPRGEDRPRWIVNITNDAWFGPSTGPEQHWNQTRFRAIEEGLPIVRSASGGWSGIVDARGRVVSAHGPQGGVVEGQVPAALTPTLYSRFGNWFVFAILAAFAALAFALPSGRDPRLRDGP
jgi:apolipoprotein N-acyltransferase